MAALQEHERQRCSFSHQELFVVRTRASVNVRVTIGAMYEKVTMLVGPLVTGSTFASAQATEPSFGFRRGARRDPRSVLGLPLSDVGAGNEPEQER